MPTNFKIYVAGSGVEIDLEDFAARFPESAYNAMARGLSHKFNNEVQSAALRKLNVKSIEEADEDKLEEVLYELRAELADKLTTGKLSVSAPGAPRGSGLEAIAFDLALAQARDFMLKEGERRGKVLWPQPDRKAGITADEATVEFAGEPRTRKEIASAFLAKHRARLMDEAEVVRAKRNADASAKKAAAAQRGEAKSDESLEDLF